jgi:hypothetical protein
MRKVHIEIAEAFKAARPKTKTARNAETGQTGHIYRIEVSSEGLVRLLYWEREIAAFDRETGILKVSNGGYTPRGYGRSRSPNMDGSPTTKALLNAVISELGVPWRIQAHDCEWQAVNHRTGQTVTEWARDGLWLNVDNGTARKGGKVHANA